MTVSLNSQRNGMRQIEMEKNGGLNDDSTKWTITGVTNNHHGRMVGRFLDDPDLGQRAVLR
jgi:hypothetical protein